MTIDIHATGCTVLYAPADAVPEADIVFVHGLQGSPRGTWFILGSSRSSQLLAKVRSGFDRKRRSASSFQIEEIRSPTSSDGRLHWPRDLLPSDCPNSRILVWGFDSKITKGYTASNKSNLFSHSNDLLYALERSREIGRQLVFIAHSLGGLIVKEALRRSEHSDDSGLRDIVESTKAVVFIATPHRGSPGYAGLGELARKIASNVLRADSNNAILRSLGLDSPELELSRGSFLQQWRKHDFQVKTFQESQGPSGMRLGLTEKIVPDISSSLDDPRERVETLQGDHKSITKFSGFDDPNYTKVSGEIKRVLAVIAQKNVELATEAMNAAERVLLSSHWQGLSQEEDDCLRSLVFEAMGHRYQNIRTALSKTCGWIYSTSEYQSWYSGDKVDENHGLLLIKGKPGAGKSTIMKNITDKIIEAKSSTANVVAFYFNARGVTLERTSLGLFRHIVHQLCQQDPIVRFEVLQLYKQKIKTATKADGWSWGQPELETILKHAYSKLRPNETYMLIDALDECDERTVREVVHFFAELAELAWQNGLTLKICLSRRHHPAISIPHCQEIIVEGANANDIATYVHRILKFMPPDEVDTAAQLKNDIIERASGVFLWAALVCDLLLQDIDDGQPIGVVTQRLKNVPKQMKDLYADLCATLTSEERSFSLCMFQWVLLDCESRVLEDVCLASLFTRGPDPHWEFESWGFNKDTTPPRTRLLRYLKKASRGLLECPNGTVQFIHETAREFFMSGAGLSIIDPSLKESPIGLSYQNLVELHLNVIDCHYECETLSVMKLYCKREVWSHARGAERLLVPIVPLLDRLEQLCPQFAGAPSVLQLYSEKGLLSCVKKCLEGGMPPEFFGGEETKFLTPLHAALGEGRVDPWLVNQIVASLIEHGASLNRADRLGYTPFLLALQNKYCECADILLQAGADTNSIDSYGRSALHIILESRGMFGAGRWRAINPNYLQCRKLFETLTAKGLHLETKDSQGFTPLICAVWWYDLFAVKTLLRNGASVNTLVGGVQEDAAQGNSALHLAASLIPFPEKIMRALVEAGCSLHVRDENGHTPLDLALMSIDIEGRRFRTEEEIRLHLGSPSVSIRNLLTPPNV